MRQRPFFLLLIATICILPVAKAQPATDTLMTTRINHIAVYVFDLKKSRVFYEDVLHLKRMDEPFKDGLHVWFAIGGGVQLHIIQGAKEIIEHVQNTHICFSVASVEPFVANLKKMNIPYFNAKGEPGIITVRVDGVQQVYFKDPDGYWIEINDARN